MISREILYNLRGGKHFTDFQVPRHCPLLFLVRVNLKDDNALLSEDTQMFKKRILSRAEEKS